jgi:hypothetical protein
MRRGRRGAGLVHEFGGSGEDSFVAVVVTKLTGALLFILLLTMVIMALIPRATDRAREIAEETAATPLTITTPEMLPEAIAGRPYAVALAATGGRGSLRWSVEGPIPEGLSFDPASGQLRGRPRKGTPEPVSLTLRVSDGDRHARGAARLVVYQPDRALTTPARFAPGLPPVPWEAWMRHGFGFLVLGLVHLAGMNTLRGLEHRQAAGGRSPGRRFIAYRAIVRLATLGATVGLVAWLWLQRGA